MIRILPHIIANPPHEAPKGGEKMGNQMTNLLLAVLMSELPGKSPLNTWAGPWGVHLRLRWCEEGAGPPSKPQTRPSSELNQS